MCPFELSRDDQAMRQALESTKKDQADLLQLLRAGSNIGTEMGASMRNCISL